MVGDWDADDLAAMLEPFAERLTKLVPAWMQRLRHLYVRHQPSVEENTLAGARAEHRAPLRPVERPLRALPRRLDDVLVGVVHAGRHARDRAGAQDRPAARRGRRRARHPPARDRHRLGLARDQRRARRGAKVTTLTLSSEQQALARQRAAAAGVGDRVDVQLRDYRDAEGQYDAVVSVEMIEAVGERYWPTYFAALDRLVTPHGRVGLQAIVLDHSRMVATRHQYTWISKYIFPGGALPSMRAIDDCVREHTNLRITERFHFGDHYARTLHCWKERFDAHADEVDAIGFDHLFRRMWDLYLAYCEAGFATGYLDVARTRPRTEALTWPPTHPSPRPWPASSPARSVATFPCGCALGRQRDRTGRHPVRGAPLATGTPPHPVEPRRARARPRLCRRRPRRRGRRRGGLPSHVGGRTRARRAAEARRTGRVRRARSPRSVSARSACDPRARLPKRARSDGSTAAAGIGRRSPITTTCRTTSTR